MTTDHIRVDALHEAARDLISSDRLLADGAYDRNEQAARLSAALACLDANRLSAQLYHRIIDTVQQQEEQNKAIDDALRPYPGAPNFSDWLKQQEAHGNG